MVFVKQSAKRFWIRSWTLPEQASFPNLEIMWMVSFCSGGWSVLAVVTRFFASALTWTFGTSPDMSVHNPRRNSHEPKHFIKEYNSATVVESAVFLIFWLSLLTRLSYDIPSSDDRSRDSARNPVMPLCEDPSSLFRWEASGNPTMPNGPVSGQNWSFTGCDLSCLASLLRAFTSPIVGEAALEAHLEKLVATLKLFPTLQPSFVPEGSCTRSALQVYNGGLPSCIVPLGSPPAPK